MNPTIGRTVLYVLSEQDGVRASAVGAVRPALVVNDNGGSSSVNLKVALDGENDWPWSPCPESLWLKSVSEGTSPGTWRWPVIAQAAPASAPAQKPPPPPPPPPAAKAPASAPAVFDPSLPTPGEPPDA